MAAMPSAKARAWSQNPSTSRADAVAAQRPEHRPDRERPAAPADLGDLVERLACRVVDQVVAVHAHRRTQGGAVADDREAAVVGDVEGLVRVGRPGVGGVAARDEVAAGRRGGRRRARRPRRRAPRRRRRGRRRSHASNGSKAPECTLPAWRHDDGGPAVTRVERGGEGGGLDPALVVGRDRLGRAEAEVAQRQVDGVVPLGAHEHAHARASRASPWVATSQPCAAQHLVAAGGQAGEVGHRPAGHEPDGAARRAGPSRSSSHASVRSSTAEWAGVSERSPEFWSHALTSQSAASAAGWVPPMTKPKNRPTASRSGRARRPCASCVDDVAGSVGPSGRPGPRRRGHALRSSGAAAPGGRRARPATRARGRGPGPGRRGRCRIPSVSAPSGSRSSGVAPGGLALASSAVSRC